MKKRIQGFVAGVLTCALFGAGAYAAQSVRIVVDGSEIVPLDGNGKRVDPIIVDGTTYLPVRAVANAFGKAVYWDGPSYTVYLGEMNGTLAYPTTEIQDVDNIGGNFCDVDSAQLTDNYGNTYANAIKAGDWSRTFQTLLNMKYSRFKCTLYVPKGYSGGDETKVSIKTDGKTIYSSPVITKTSRPIPVDVDIRGCNDFQIEVTGRGTEEGFIADAGFYQ